MAQSRILSYDGQFVTFYYDRHEDNKRVVEKVHAIEFIKRLIIHIPNEEFKMIRYYGLYSAKGMMRLSSYQRKSSYLKSNFAFKWRSLLYLSFKYDILKCRCGYYLKFIRESSYFP